MARIAIIGGGNMGEALLAGLLRSGRQVKDLVVAERAPARTEHLSQTYGVQVTGSITDAAAHADYVVVAVKPADVTAAVNAIAEAAAIAEDSSTEQVFVTVAAGVGTGFFESKLPAGSAVVRAMPNTPALVGAGVTAGSDARCEQSDQEYSCFAHRGSPGDVGETDVRKVPVRGAEMVSEP